MASRFQQFSTPETGGVPENQGVDGVDLSGIKDESLSGIHSSSTPISPKRGILLLTPNSHGRNNRVCFSPTKEIVSFNNDEDATYTVNVDRMDDGHSGDKRGFSLADPRIPYMVLLYAQLLFNLLLMGIVAYVMVVFVLTLRGDIKRKIEVFTMDAIKEISRCSRDYYKNKCLVHERAPALEDQCIQWEKCMNRDPQSIGRSKITAHTFGEIVNSFLQPISWKALFLCNILVFGAFFLVNFVFRSYRQQTDVQTEEKIRVLEQRLGETERKQGLGSLIAYYASGHDDSMNSPLVRRGRRT